MTTNLDTARNDLRDHLRAAILRMEMTTQDPAPLPEMLAAILPSARRACTPELVGAVVADLVAEVLTINAAGNPILSGWLADARAALAAWKLAELAAATAALLAEHAEMNADLRARGCGRIDADNGAHPDAPAPAARAALALVS